MASHRCISRRTALGLLGAGALGLLALGSLTGCSPTDADVYIPTSVTVHSSSGETLATTAYVLDERGNARETQTVTPQGTDSRVEAFDAYGVPVAVDSAPCTVTYDDKGQPTEIEGSAAAGAETVTWRYTYYDVRGRIHEAIYLSADYSHAMAFDRDGWPLSGDMVLNGHRHDIRFVYEVDLNGAVTRQNVLIDEAEKPSLWYTYTYETTEGSTDGSQNNLVRTRTDDQGTTTTYAYELVEDPSPYAMALALLHAPDYAAIHKAIEG